MRIPARRRGSSWNLLEVLTHMEDECSLHLAHEPDYPRLRAQPRPGFLQARRFRTRRKWIGIYL